MGYQGETKHSSPVVYFKKAIYWIHVGRVLEIQKACNVPLNVGVIDKKKICTCQLSKTIPIICNC